MSDGGGLFIYLPPSGSKLWRMAYRFDGKQKLLSFGPYPAVSLTDARSRREEAKALLAGGIDPGQHQREVKAAEKAAVENTFNAIADELLAKEAREGRAEATLGKKAWLLSLARPDLGERAIAGVTPPEVLEVLRKVEAKGNFETARRLRSTIGQVFRYAIATARAEIDPTASLKGALTSPVATPRAALTKKEDFANLVRAIWAYDGGTITRAGLQLLALLYPRPGELRQAHWAEFDLDAEVWVIPKERTKMRREHRKPLSGLALSILTELRDLTGSGPLAFPAIHTNQRPMSENTLNTALRRLGFTADQATSHGFRASASSLLNESGKWSPDAIEAELGHVGGDQVRRAYHRTTYWEQRVRMTEWWANKIAACAEATAQFESSETLIESSK